MIRPSTQSTVTSRGLEAFRTPCGCARHLRAFVALALNDLTDWQPSYQSEFLISYQRNQVSENVQVAQLQAALDTTNIKLTFAQAEVAAQEKQFTEEYGLWESKFARVSAKHDECVAYIPPHL
jgi:hypothetical protein